MGIALKYQHSPSILVFDKLIEIVWVVSEMAAEQKKGEKKEEGRQGKMKMSVANYSPSPPPFELPNSAGTSF